MAVGRAAIDKAVINRAEEFRVQKDTLTMKAVRRLLEEDLGLETKELDKEKEYVDNLVMKIITKNTTAKKQEAKPAVSVKKQKRQVARKVESSSEVDEQREEEGSDENSEGARDADEEEEDRAAHHSDNRIGKEKQMAKRRRKEVEETEEDEEEGEEEDTKRTEGGQRRPAQQKPIYGKRVEHLREIIKECGLKIPPIVYKKANQAREGQQEAVLVKELQTLLQKEGLSASPSKAEIKAVARRIQKKKDLEGIDMSNVIDAPRSKRKSASFIPPAKYKEDDSEAESEQEEEVGEDDEEDEGSEEESEEGDEDE